MLSLTEMAGKAIGAARAATAALAGYRGIFRTLKREHGEVSVLLMRIATERSSLVRARLFTLASRELMAHAQAEDAEFYSILADHAETRGLVLDLEADHEHIEHLLAELEALPPGETAWHERFRELQRAVNEHIDCEENRVFPIARHLLGTEAAEEIDHRYHLQKRHEARAPIAPIDPPL